MKKQKKSRGAPSLQEVAKQFKAWRRHRRPRDPIPEDLWSSAANLAETCSVHKVAKRLRLNHAALKERVEAGASRRGKKSASTLSFVEVPWRGSEMMKPSGMPCVIEMRRRSGEELTVSFPGEVELLALCRLFFGGQG
jgi:hypothetical protein